jgi:PAS domain S-box-containing protein
MLPKTTLAQWPTTFDAINDAVCLLDMNGKILQCNKAMESLLKKSSKEIIGSTCCELVHGTDKPVKGCPIVRMKKTLCRETLVVKVDNKWLNVSVDPLIDETGNLAGAVHIISDITQRKQAEAELLLKDLVFEHSITANSISNNAGIITHLNDTFIRLYGYESRNEAIGKPISDFLKFEDEAMNIITALNETGVWEGEYTGLRKDGTTFVAYGLATVIKDRSGDSIGYQSAVLDITEREKREEAIKESKERYRGLSEATFEAIFISEKGVCLEQNSAAEKMFGYTLSEAIARKGIEWIAPDDREMVMNNMLSGYEGPYEATALRKDGSTFSAEIQGKMMHYKGRTVRVTALNDITKRKQAEEELRKSEQRFRSIFENIPNIAVQGYNADRKIIFWNQASEKLYGYKKEEAIGNQLEDLIIPSKMRESVIEAIRNCVENGIPIPHGELKLMRKDKTTFPVYSSHIILKNIKGEFEMYCIDIDMTERKQAEGALRESEEKYRRLFNTESDAIMIFDAETLEFIDVNESALSLYGYTREEFLKLRQPAITAEPEESEASIKKTLAGKLIRIPIRYHKKKDGTIFSVEISAGTFTLKNRKVFFGVIRDITKRKLAEETLLNSEKRLHYLSSQLITAQEKERRRISLELHDEMGQALTAISINVRSIEKELPSDLTPLIKEKIAEIYSLADQASEQIRELSHYLRPSMLDDLGLVPTLRWYLDVYRKRTNLDVKYEPINFEERPSLEVETVIYRIVQEALNNIVKHAQAGSVLVRVERKDKEAVVFINDNGRGFEVNEFLAPDDLKGGIGILGMQERVSILGGKFSIQSSKGHGTSISVEIPLH